MELQVSINHIYIDKSSAEQQSYFTEEFTTLCSLISLYNPLPAKSKIVEIAKPIEPSPNPEWFFVSHEEFISIVKKMEIQHLLWSPDKNKILTALLTHV